MAAPPSFNTPLVGKLIILNIDGVVLSGSVPVKLIMAVSCSVTVTNCSLATGASLID